MTFSNGFLCGLLLASLLSRLTVWVVERRHARELDAWAAREGLARAVGETSKALAERCQDAAIMRQARSIADAAVDAALPQIVTNMVARAEWTEATGPRGQA